MQEDMELTGSSSSSLYSHEHLDNHQLADEFDFKLNFLNCEDHEEDEEEEHEYEVAVEEEEDEEEEDDDDDFSFVINESDSSSISTDYGQIQPVFPLFNQKLLLAQEDYKISENRLPLRPPVNKVFIETPPSTSTENTEEIAAGPYCEFHPELSKKSNSTGFSKLWRFKDYMHRSHSDGRDAFVFLNGSDQTKREVRKKPALPSEKLTSAGEVKSNAAAADGGKKIVKKVKKTTAISAHEAYLRSKEEDKRKSYLPYRPELVGFFTNVNGGGLTKNVHPY